MQARELQNPFLVHQIDATDRLPPGDVPELHAGVLDRCKANVVQARQARQGLGLLVTGEAGSGKSHLIAQLRRALLPDPQAVLAAIPLHGAYSGHLWRHVRERLVSELFREIPSESKETNGLLRILRNRFPRWADPAQSGGLLDWLLGKSKSVGSLQPYLEAFAKTQSLDFAFIRVLSKVGDAELSLLARQWLQGEQFADEDLARLGLPHASPNDLEQEQSARKVVLSLLALAGSMTTLVICFDQVESLQAGVVDAVSLRQFATLANELISLPGPRVVTTFIRPRLQLEMQKAVEVANMQRIAQDRASIPPLTWEQAVRLTRSRLEAEMTCRVARQDHPADPDWPLGHSFLEKTFRDNRRDLTPRHLITACRLEFDRVQRKGDPKLPDRTVAGSTPPPPPPHPPSPGTIKEWLDRAWEKKRQQQFATVENIPFDQVMGLGLPWLVEEAAVPYDRIHDIPKALGDANLLFRPTSHKAGPLAISFCNQEPMTLWRRLDRVKKQWETCRGVMGSLVVLRWKDARTTEKGQERLDSLRAAGVRVMLVDKQQLSELATYQKMLSMTHDGDILLEGRPIEIEVFNEWAKKHLTSAVKEFLDTVFEPDGKRAAKPAKVSAARI